jgi:hypothetical protein
MVGPEHCHFHEVEQVADVYVCKDRTPVSCDIIILIAQEIAGC